MDYSGGQTLIKVFMYILMVSSASHTLLDRSPETFPADSHEDSEYMYCDYESPCSWSLSNHSGSSDWQVVSPQQSHLGRRGLRPVTDHSVGNAGGHYLVLGPSLSAVAPGSCEFHATSPVLMGSGPLCHLRVARFHPPPSGGNLSVLIRRADSPAILKTLALSTTGRGSSRAYWEELEAAIGLVDEPFQVTLLYSGCLKDDGALLAIDSLELPGCEDDHGLDSDCDESMTLHCNFGGCIDKSRVCDFHTDCPLGEDEGFICDSLPFGAHCSFESGPCGWSVSERPSSWVLSSGEELGNRRGLLGTTLQLTQGHFLYLRVRSSRLSGEAVMQSPSLPQTVSARDCQLRFSVYLYGDFNGTVMISLESNGTTMSLLVFERSGLWKDNWQEVTLPISRILNGFHIKVRALWGPASYAEIALDDITLGAACFKSDLSSLLLHGDGFLHGLDSLSDVDYFSPLPEPSSSEVSLMTWWFTSCGASGPRGPTQAQCDNAYRNTNVSVTVIKEGSLKGVQKWRVPATNRYKISAYGAAGGKGAKNHNKRSHGVLISAIFPLEKGDMLYILVGHQGEDACPGRNPLTEKMCLGESSVIEDSFVKEGKDSEWRGGGGGGGGATYIFKMVNGELMALLIAAGGGGKAYLEDPDSSLDQLQLEQYENDTSAPCHNGRTGAAGGGGGWRDSTTQLWAGKSLVEGAEGGSSCPRALSRLSWDTFGGFGGGGGACTAGGGGGGYRGGDSALFDNITADGQDGVSYVHHSGEIFLQPLAVMESHGEAEIEVHLNCSHCQTQSCKRDDNTRLINCLCHNEEVLAPDNVSCIVSLTFDPPVPPEAVPEGHLPLSLILAVVASTVVTGIVLTCASLTFIYYRKKNHLHAVRVRLQSPEYKLSKIRSSTIMTDYNPNYCFAGKAASLSDLKEVPRKNISLLRALGHGAFGEVYEGQVLGMNGENSAMQVAIKTLPEICSEQDEMDFLMEALIMSKFSHQNIVRCIGVSLQILPRFILLELMTGGDMKSFLRQNRPKANQTSSLTMLELLHMARDIALGCRYLEENHFIHRDIAARNCLLTCTGQERVAKIGDFGMARDIYRASYYRKGGRAMLPVKWMPPEAFLEGIFTCKTDTWSFGVLLWEIFSLGYMPYPCKTNQEVLEFVTSGGRMDPPKSCPGPVYRIMTQCWQHCPEHRPNFSTILERINYCTQDPDVINTPLPVEYGPTMEDEGSTVMRPEGSGSMSPLLVSHSLSQDASLPPASVTLGGVVSPLPQIHKPRLLLQRPQPLPQEAAASYRDALEPSWAEPVPPLAICSGSWLQVPVTAAAAAAATEFPHHRPCSRSSSSSGSQKLKNKTKNLWNPTYGSWVLESIGRAKTALSHTQSVPLSCSAAACSVPTGAPLSTSERNDPESAGGGGGCQASGGLVPAATVLPAPCQTSTGPQGLNSGLSLRKSPLGVAAGGGGGGASGVPPASAMDLAKLQTFPCGNVNYAYDEQSYEAESLPLVVPKAVEPSRAAAAAVHSSSPGLSLAGLALALPSTSGHKPLVKRHASYGHEDIKRHAKAEKPTRDRDSGFSLSEDLSVTPV
ncbi:leukocyte tyrosine kinase receptor isoform X1 [Alosa sapidissima]|uniref:leukocyte tyrosine kinase receptor isoform X1 n=1 Tax=Alosa sapidissima TaxID=34773 RepID=UPI001C08213D|nr:leukocyte tyrosine kinase receptor isoform X1 [Alosa sapidissima]